MTNETEALDPKGLEAAIKASFTSPVGESMTANAIRAYLAAVPSPLAEALEVIRPFAAVEFPKFQIGQSDQFKPWHGIPLTMGDFRRAREAIAALSAVPACPMCKGTGSCADYVGDDMRCIEVECSKCHGTGALSAVPMTEGWQLVPVEPTEAMRSVVNPPIQEWVWRAMLSAAPKREA